MAEEMARLWGNIDYGIRELSNKVGESEMEAYCWDMQTNVYTSQKFTVKHERHTKSGKYNLTDPRDIYEMTANQGARRLRARILAVLPPDLIDAASTQCQQTLKTGNNKPADMVAKATTWLATYGVTPAMVTERYGCTPDKMTIENAIELRAICASIKDNISHASQWFTGIKPPASTTVDALNEGLTDTEPASPDAVIL
jgi:hypothetical protein